MASFLFYFFFFSFFSLFFFFFCESRCGDLNCPAGFIFASNEDEYAFVNPYTTTGYIAFGAGGSWILKPYKKKYGSQMEFACDGWLGDPNIGCDKICCRTDKDIKIDGISDISFDNNYINEDDWKIDIPINSITTMSYGNSNGMFFKFITAAHTKCDNTYFGDPLRGVDKICQWVHNKYPKGLKNALNNQEWSEISANENNAFSLKIPGIANWVKYGFADNWFYQLLLITRKDATFTCSNRLFNDPDENNYKFCYIGRSEISHTTPIGKWIKADSHCGTCTNNEWKLSVGVTNKKEDEITNSWSNTITATVKAEYKAVEGSLSYSTTLAMANRIQKTIEVGVVKEITRSCNKLNSVLWEYKTTISENNGIFNNAIDFYDSQNSNGVLCLNQYNNNGVLIKPKCLPGFCVLQNDCQTCTYCNSPTKNYQLLYSNKSPHCTNHRILGCFSGTSGLSEIEAEAKCNTLDSCIGFSYKNRNGCFKQKDDCDKNGFSHISENYQYWEKCPPVEPIHYG